VQRDKKTLELIKKMRKEAAGKKVEASDIEKQIEAAKAKIKTFQV